MNVLIPFKKLSLLFSEKILNQQTNQCSLMGQDSFQGENITQVMQSGTLKEIMQFSINFQDIILHKGQKQKTVLKLDDKENKGPLVIYSDSSYVVRSLTDYLSVWKKRGFVVQFLVHSDTLKEIFVLASKKPNCYAIIKLKAHKKGDDELTIGNSTADSLAKEAAMAGEETIDTKLEQVFPLRKTVTANMP